MTFYNINRKYKDRVFRIIFRDKQDLLQLYNAVNNSNYTNPDDLEITTIEDIVYMGMKNDLSFVIGDIMNLYEHQGSFSPNLPLRGLFYFASLYRNYIEPVKQRLYAETPLMIPFPQYIVFYNGTKDEPERQERKLSDLFIHSEKEMTPALECMAVMLNINLGFNQKLMKKCKKLEEYAQFIATIRRHQEMETDFSQAVELAVEECISNGILSEILRKNKAEVIDVIMTEWDENEYRDFLKEEAWNAGHESGVQEGLQKGMQDGIQKGIQETIRHTLRTCMNLGVSKEQMIENLIKEFALSADEANSYIEMYWKK